MDSWHNEPRYFISVAARMVRVETHTLRYYEKIGIIEPYRSRGNIRLYSDQDIAYIQRVKSLMDELGISLAGADVILRMAGRITELKGRVTALESENLTLRKEQADSSGG